MPPAAAVPAHLNTRRPSFPGITPEMARMRFEFSYSQTYSLAASANDKISISTMSDSWFVVQAIVADNDGDLNIQFNDTGSGAFWSSAAIDLQLVAGTIQLPNILLTPLLLRPSSQVVIDVTDTSGLANTGQITLVGYKVYERDVPAWTAGPKPDMWFQYGGTKDLTAGALDTLNLQIQADAHFEVHKMLARATGSFQAKVTDSGTGKSWSDTYVRRGNFAGVAQRPKVLTFPKLILPNTVIQVELQDLSGAANTIRLALEGAKRFVV